MFSAKVGYDKFQPFPPDLYSKERESKSFFRKWAVALLRVFLQTAASDRDAIKPLHAICFRTGLPLLDLFRFLCPLMMHDICYYFNNRHTMGCPRELCSVYPM